jgi:hypothetical protein
VRQLLISACLAAPLVWYDETYSFIEQADPLVKLLLGAGVVLFVWLLVLWRDLAYFGKTRGDSIR